MDKYTGVEIAVIGMSGRFPGAENIYEYWENLAQGKEHICFHTDKELLEAGIPADMLADPAFVKASAYIDNKEYFDAAFFGYLPDEAKLMDPQLRLFHQSCWAALEDAGYNVKDTKDKIGLFAGGAINNNWENYAILSNMKQLADGYTAANLRNVAYLCSRVSYALNLRGPAVFINTACSTSLVAVHQACMSLLLRECNMALAGGIRINNHSKAGYRYEEGMINSEDGHCRPFDAAGTGTILGEGVGVVLLKRLKDALNDNDHIYAIIRGSAVNNDGHQKISFTAPSVDGQYNAILKAINMAGVEPASISYVEAHGTATKLGDPIEVEALHLAFGRSPQKYCALGAVKSNIGHLDTAAGIAGFIKTVLALQHRQIPPSLHYTRPNPEIDFSNSPFYVNTALRNWERNKYPLRAGVSSFGIGGTNAHIVLEEAPAPEKAVAGRDRHLLLWSGKTPEALKRNIDDFRDYLEKQADASLPDIAYTQQLGRVPFEYRKALLCRDREEALQLLQSPTLWNQPLLPVAKAAPLKVFMFPGQGSQYAGMAADLYRSEPLFRAEMDQCFEIVSRLSGKDLKTLIFSSAGTGLTSRIDETEWAQPALFVVSYALARLLMQLGITPDIMIGHSIGEYVAACISGVFSLEDALSLVLKRGELMQQMAPGSMLSISITEMELHVLLEQQPEICLAAVNSTELCVVSGTQHAIARFRALLDQQGYVTRILHTSHAFHSSMMDPMLDAFEKEVAARKSGLAAIPFISNLHGRKITDKEATQAAYWSGHLRQTVRFAAGIETLLATEQAVFIELGPGKVLSTLLRSNKNSKRTHHSIQLLPAQPDKETDSQRFLSALGELWVHGIMPDWKLLYGSEKRRKVSLPAYSFERVAYPVNVDALDLVSGMVKEMIAEAPLRRNPDLSKWFYAPTWKLAPLLPAPLPAKSMGCTVIFADGQGIADALAGKYNEQELVIVRKGTAFREYTPFLYEIDPGSAEDYKMLGAGLSAAGLSPACVLHAWAVTGSAGDELPGEYGDTLFFSLLQIVKQFSLGGSSAGKRLLLLADGLHRVLDTGAVAAVKSLPLGLLKVISQEFPDIEATHLDIALEEAGPVLIDNIYREIHAAQKGRIICLRHGKRWEQVFDQLPTSPDLAHVPLKAQGVYLITGGLGALGFHLSLCLLKHLQAKVILLGRNALDDGGATTAQKRRRLQLLEEEGEVLYLQADLTDVESMHRAIGIGEEKFGPLNGVVHAAGVISGSSVNPLNELRRDDLDIQFAPKIIATQVLEQVLAGRQPDFCMLVSSLSAVLGGVGFGAYAPANVYMDYFVRSRQQQGALKNWISVNFDGLNFSKDDTEHINQPEIFEVFTRALSLRDTPQVAVSTADLHTRLQKWVFAQTATVDTAVAARQTEETASPGDPTDMETALITLWRDFFGNPGITADDDFFEIGGDSLKALAMMRRLEDWFDLKVPFKVFLASPSIRGICDHISFAATDNIGITH
jgi:acyl transferase domain-containing protein/acyl carrier protein